MLSEHLINWFGLIHRRYTQILFQKFNTRYGTDNACCACSKNFQQLCEKKKEMIKMNNIRSLYVNNMLYMRVNLTLFSESNCIISFMVMDLSETLNWFHCLAIVRSDFLTIPGKIKPFKDGVSNSLSVRNKKIC